MPFPASQPPGHPKRYPSLSVRTRVFRRRSLGSHLKKEPVRCEAMALSDPRRVDGVDLEEHDRDRLLEQCMMITQLSICAEDAGRMMLENGSVAAARGLENL